MRALPYKRVAQLVRDYLADDDADTIALIRELRPARARGYLTRSELEKVCRWKSPRALQHIRSNSASRVRDTTKRALATRSERQRLEALLELNKNLESNPESVNKDPYGNGWMVRVEMSNPAEVDGLMSAADYRKMTGVNA